MRRHLSLFATAILLPGVALAHGEQVLAMPVAQGAAFVVLVVAACVLRMSRLTRILFVNLPILAMAAIWLLPGLPGPGLIGAKFGYGFGPMIAVGLVPPIVVAGTIYFLGRMRDSERKKNA